MSSVDLPADVKNKADAIADVDIDGEGKFKYILINVQYKDGSQYKDVKRIVRGYKRADFHADIYDEVEPGMRGLGFFCECLGGGRILHEVSEKKLFVYGYSQGFGRPDHSVTTEILKKAYPDYEEIIWSNEGY